MTRPTPLDALVIGGGPAGCSCALWLHQLGLSTALVERQSGLGGLQGESPYPNTWIAGVMGLKGIEFARRLDEHVSSLGIPVLRRTAPRQVTRDSRGFRVAAVSDSGPVELEARHLVIATGVEPRTGGLEAGPHVIIGPGRAVEACDFAGLRVAILGGGDNAAENYGLIGARRPADLRIYARTRRARAALSRNVPEQAFRVGPYHVDQDTRSVTFDGRTERFDVLVVLYGWQAVIPEALGEMAGTIVDERGFISTDRERRTAVPGLWAIGEVTQAVHPCCVTAMSDGVICAKAIERDRGA